MAPGPQGSSTHSSTSMQNLPSPVKPESQMHSTSSVSVFEHEAARSQGFKSLPQTSKARIVTSALRATAPGESASFTETKHCNRSPAATLLP